MICKVVLTSEKDAQQFRQEVIDNGGDAYQWWKTTCVVFKGPVPEGYEYRTEPVTDYDRVMLRVGWA